MEYKQLYIFVEGEDDERFFNSQIRPLFEPRYNYIKFIRYATLKNSKIENLIIAIRKQKKSSEYIFIADFDSRKNNEICVSKRKAEKIKLYKSLESRKISIVKEEIESWYYAGISKDEIKKYNLKKMNNTEKIDKELFENLMPKEILYKNDFFIEILKNYSTDLAKEKNKSFEYFINKYADI